MTGFLSITFSENDPARNGALYSGSMEESFGRSSGRCKEKKTSGM
jgi:hypothetical protein